MCLFNENTLIEWKGVYWIQNCLLIENEDWKGALEHN